MSKTWIFIDGMLTGAASVFVVAAVAVELEGWKNSNSDTVEEKEKLTLPEGKDTLSQL